MDHQTPYTRRKTKAITDGTTPTSSLNTPNMTSSHTTETRVLGRIEMPEESPRDGQKFFPSLYGQPEEVIDMNVLNRLAILADQIDAPALSKTMKVFASTK